MEKEFIPYEQALAMKEMGFNEDCAAVVYPDNEVLIENSNTVDIMLRRDPDCIKSPLYQQAFRWFRRDHGLPSSVYKANGEYTYAISGETEGKWKAFQDYSTEHEDAELACLNKLIEIVQTKK